MDLLRMRCRSVREVHARRRALTQALDKADVTTRCGKFSSKCGTVASCTLLLVRTICDPICDPKCGNRTDITREMSVFKGILP